jgi:hypothetical protein
MRRSQGRRGIFEHAFAALGIMLFTFRRAAMGEVEGGLRLGRGEFLEDDPADSGGLAQGGGQALQPVRWRKA